MPPRRNPEPSAVTEIIANDAGVPYLFVAAPADLAAAMDRIPDKVFREAFAYAWRRRADAPKLTGRQIRQRALEVHMYSPLLRGADALDQKGRRAALRRPRRWHLVPMQPDPRTLEDPACSRKV